MNENNLEKIFDFLKIIENLKSTLRYNKTTSGRQESSAEHTWRLALMVFLMAEELKLDVDAARSVKIALVHDIAEAITGDIDAVLIAEGKFSKEEKDKNEIEAIARMQALLPENPGNEIAGLWNEYNDGKTKEAKFVKAMDKIETHTQLVESGYKTYDKPEYIANYANKAVKQFPELLPMLKILKKKFKAEFAKGNIEWKKDYDSLD